MIQEGANVISQTDQMIIIIQTLGVLSEDDISFVQEKSVKSYIK
jgi:hypothetical protein